MKYIVVVNNEERLSNGDEQDVALDAEEISELLRDGYFEVESVTPA